MIGVSAQGENSQMERRMGSSQCDPSFPVPADWHSQTKILHVDASSRPSIKQLPSFSPFSQSWEKDGIISLQRWTVWEADGLSSRWCTGWLCVSRTHSSCRQDVCVHTRHPTHPRHLRSHLKLQRRKEVCKKGARGEFFFFLYSREKRNWVHLHAFTMPKEMRSLCYWKNHYHM